MKTRAFERKEGAERKRQGATNGENEKEKREDGRSMKK